MTSENEEVIEVPEDDLYELYSTLSGATTAASAGDPNECARLAAEAKRMVLDIRREADGEE